MKKIISLIAIAAMSAIAFTSCEPAEKIYEGNDAKVFFDASNTDLVLLEDGQTSVEVKVARKDAAESITIGITVNSASEGLVIPASVKFDANESETSFEIGLPDSNPVGSVYELNIELKGADIFQEESTSYSVMIANPERIVARTTPSLYMDKYLGEWNTEILKISDKLFILPNLWNSGVNVRLSYTATVGSEEEPYYLLAVSADGGYSATLEKYEDYSYWWFYDPETYDPIYFYPFGEDEDYILASGFMYNVTDQNDNTYYNTCYYNVNSKRIELTTDIYLYRNEKWTDVLYEYVSLRMGSSATAGFEPWIPEPKEEGAAVSVTAYLSKTPETTFTFEGYWDTTDPNKFIFKSGETGLLYYSDLEATVDTDGSVSLKGTYVEYYEDATYGKYYWVSDYFNVGDYYQGYVYLNSNTKWDAANKTFYLSCDLTPDNGKNYVTDVLVLKLN